MSGEESRTSRHGPDSVWVTNPLAGTLTEIDSATVTPERTVELQGVPDSVAVDGDTGG